VLAIGGNEQTSREAWAFWHLGDRPSLDLIGRQEELVRAMLATGKPVVVFLFNGRPLSINYAQPRSAGDFRMLVPGPGNRPRGGRSLFGDSTPAASCPSPFRARPAICRRSTITSRPRAAAISSTM
jgi:beta-glucosidase